MPPAMNPLSKETFHTFLSETQDVTDDSGVMLGLKNDLASIQPPKVVGLSPETGFNTQEGSDSADEDDPVVIIGMGRAIYNLIDWCYGTIFL